MQSQKIQQRPINRIRSLWPQNRRLRQHLNIAHLKLLDKDVAQLLLQTHLYIWRKRHPLQQNVARANIHRSQ
jgi:hypothetical protein